ncbi:MAG: non-ribosomal peptide synthetase, partial [Acidobacteria bacterium]
DGERRRLVAAVAAGRATTAAQLAAFLRRRLPEPLVPSAFLILPSLPRTPAGKLDRAALESAAAAAAPAPAAGPAGELEAAIAELWCELLGRTAVGLDDSFFDLGGHSLLLLRLRARLEARLDRRLPVVDLFQHPTVRALAAHLKGAGDDEGTPAHAGARRRARQQAVGELRRRRRRQRELRRAGR